MPDTRDLVKQRFGAHAQNYVDSKDHSRGDSLERLIDLVQPQAGWRALDIATGGGHTALKLAPHVREVVASDLTPDMLAAAERFIRGQGVQNVVFREADATRLPFADAEFDLVTCRVAPHHFPDCGQFVRETARVLRPGGLAVMIDNVAPEDAVAARHINALEKLRDPSHNWAYSQSDWTGFFEAAGLAIRHAELFRKARDLDYWADMMDVDPATRLRLRVMLQQAPEPARQSLEPKFTGDPQSGPVTFYLIEILILAERPA